MKCVLAYCEAEALPGDWVCAQHARFYRRHRGEMPTCGLCGRKLVGPLGRMAGRCLPSCEERAHDEALARRAREGRRPRRTRRRDRTRRLPGPGPEGSMEP